MNILIFIRLEKSILIFIAVERINCIGIMYCFLCKSSIEDQGGLQFSGCYHFLCTDCLIDAVCTTAVMGVRCPAYRKFKKCQGRIDHELLENMVPESAYAEYLERIATSEKHTDSDYEHGDDSLEDYPFDDGTSCNQNPNSSLELNEEDKKFGWCHQLLFYQDLVQNQGLSRAQAKFCLENNAILETRVTIDCAICFLEIPAGEGIVLKECLHMFCKACLVDMIQVRVNEDAVVKCPYMDGNYSCVYFLQEREVRALVPDELYQKLLEKSMKLGEATIEKSFHCRTLDCPGWCVYDDGVQKFDCPVCNKQNCIPCQAIHENSCEEYQKEVKLKKENQRDDKLSEEAIEEEIRQGLTMRCPKCQVPVQKITGCDWTQCAGCKLELCWATKGPRWGPKGHGDISGGCKCNVNNVRCHPNCRNCH